MNRPGRIGVELQVRIAVLAARPVQWRAADTLQKGGPNGAWPSANTFNSFPRQTKYGVVQPLIWLG